MKLEKNKKIKFNGRDIKVIDLLGDGGQGEVYLIEDAGKLDAPGRPTTYKVTEEFLRLFGYKDLEELPDLPRYKIDENQQIVIEDIIENKGTIQEEN